MEEFQIQEGGTAKFNAGVNKINRMHELRMLLNLCKLNPEAYNSEYAEFQHTLILRVLNVYLFEIISKLNPTERNECIKLKEAIESAFTKYPVRENRRASPSGKFDNIFLEDRWIIIKKYLEIYEEKLNLYSDRHKFEMPEADESALF